MKTKHQIALQLIKEYEGFRPISYMCPAGVMTIGYGRTTGNLESRTTEEVESAWLYQEVLELDRFLNKHVIVYLNETRMAALISFIYNVGKNAFLKSTLLKRLNNYDYAGAGYELTRWVKAGQLTLPGLVRRRDAERAWFDYVSQSDVPF